MLTDDEKREVIMLAKEIITIDSTRQAESIYFIYLYISIRMLFFMQKFPREVQCKEAIALTLKEYRELGGTQISYKDIFMQPTNADDDSFSYMQNKELVRKLLIKPEELEAFTPQPKSPLANLLFLEAIICSKHIDDLAANLKYVTTETIANNKG